MRRSFYVAFALVLVAATTQARADMVTYTMTGTILQTWHPFNSYTSAYAVGDRIVWTVQYDRSTPPLWPVGQQYGTSEYKMNAPVFSNILDATHGGGFTTPSTWSSTFLLTNWWHPSGQFQYNWNALQITANQQASTWWGGSSNYTASLHLVSKDVLPTLKLANLQLNNIPLSSGEFNYTNPYGFGFQAQVDSIGTRPEPEPGSFTLFLLGVAGLTARGLRRRFVQVGYNEPEA